MDHPSLFKVFTLPSLVLLMWFVRKVLPESFLQVSPLQRVGHCRCWLRLPQSHRRSHHRPIGPNPSHVTRSGMITLTGWIFKGPPRWMRVRACRAPRAQSTESWCHARALGCPARHHWRTGKDPEMTQGSSGTIWDMKEIQPKAQSPPTPEKTLAWEPLECFRFHPHEPMIFLEVGITLIPYSLLHPPMDIWHIGGGALLPVAFQRALTLEHTGPLNVCKSMQWRNILSAFHLATKPKRSASSYMLPCHQETFLKRTVCEVPTM